MSQTTAATLRLTVRLAELLGQEAVRDWNPRYLVYVVAQGSKSVEEQRAKDHERWPGGGMTGFILWTAERWRAWRTERGIAMNSPLFDADHRDFDGWLADGLSPSQLPLLEAAID